MAQKESSVKSYNSGKWKLVVNYKVSNSGISVRPYIRITDAMKDTHNVSLTWTKRGKTTTQKKVKNKGLYLRPSKYGTCKAMSCTVTAKVGSSSVTVTIKSTLRPNAPTVSAKYNSDYSATLTYKGQAYQGKDVSSFTIQRQTDVADASWDSVATVSAPYTSAYTRTYTDTQIEPGHRYRWRIGATNSNGASYTTTGWLYTSAPDLDGAEHSRISDYECDIAITRDRQAVARSLLTKISIQRNDNGASTWHEVARAPAGSSADTIVHYRDKTCLPDCFYKYRVAGVNARGVSKVEAPSETGTDATYNTPAAPKSIKAVYNTNGNVVLTLDNAPHTATGLEIQRSLDGNLWENLATVDESQTICTLYTDETEIAGDTAYYRARNIREEDNDTLASAYTYSGAVSTLLQPNPPTLVSPLSAANIILEAETTRLIWVHNPQDGTEQTAATVYYKLTSEPEWHRHAISGGTSYWDMELDASYLSAGVEVQWKVQTKGQHALYSKESEIFTFRIISKPKLSFVLPENGATIENLPITLGFQYSDDSGSLDTLTLEVIQDGESVYKTRLAAGTQELTYKFSEFLFTNESAYQLAATAVSTSGLSAAATLGIYVAYVTVTLTDGVTIAVEVDEDTGYAHVLIEVEEAGTASDETITDGTGETDEGDLEEVPIIVNSPPDRSYLYRVTNGNRVLVAADLHAQDQVVDKHAPLNNEFGYELLTVAQNGAIALDNYSAYLGCEYWFCYWGADNIAKARWNPSGDISISRPEKTQVRYSGRKYPVSYDSAAMEETMKLSAYLNDYEELQNFRKLIADGGQGVWKGCDGEVYKADFDLSYSADYTRIARGWDLSIDVTRIDSEDL